MRYFTLTVFLFVILGVPAFAFSGFGSAMIDNLDYVIDQKEQGDASSMTDEERLIMIQAHFIENTFLRFLVEEDPILELVKDDDEEEPMLDTTQESSFYKKMMAKRISKQLAERDILGMKDRYMKDKISIDELRQFN